jgi:hypothetical protein
MVKERDFVPPVEARADGWHLNFEREELVLLIRLLGELKTLLTSEENETTKPLLHRLFPPAFLDDEDKEAEYQRLMREELVASRVAAVDNVTKILEPRRGKRGKSDAKPAALTENETMAFMQSVNAVRLVLGTMLDITDDESADVADMDDSPEHHLYSYLGWVLEWTVRSLTPG